MVTTVLPQGFPHHKGMENLYGKTIETNVDNSWPGSWGIASPTPTDPETKINISPSYP